MGRESTTTKKCAKMQPVAGGRRVSPRSTLARPLVCRTSRRSSPAASPCPVQPEAACVGSRPWGSQSHSFTITIIYRSANISRPSLSKDLQATPALGMYSNGQNSKKADNGVQNDSSHPRLLDCSQLLLSSLDQFMLGPSHFFQILHPSWTIFFFRFR